MLRDRFSAPLDPAATRFSDSTPEDRALLPHDLWGSAVHARMLGATGIIPRRSAARILAGLSAIGREASAGRFRLDPRLEDVHLNVERALTRRIGTDGERLHTARSRNDQVATDLALFERDALLALERATLDLVRALLAAARGRGGRRVVSGWTHLQPAQRIYWAQILGSHGLRFVRDAQRLAATRATLTDCPLGSGAIAGSSLPIDRVATARALGFLRPSPSSLESVSDRDAAVEILGDLALLAAHLSALAEELVLGAMPEIGRVALADPFVTTSSLMPHKRNPDLAELARAEAGPTIGRLVSALSVLKGLPIGYQRDLQRVKRDLVEGVGPALALLAVMTPMIASAEYLPGAATEGTGSVELVDALVGAGVPFRSAHGRVARWVRARPPPPFATAFPELRGSGFTPARPSEEPERRTSRGGSAWVEVDRLLVEVRDRSRALGRATEREVRRLDRLRRGAGALPPPFLVPARSRPASRANRGRGRTGRRPRGGQ